MTAVFTGTDTDQQSPGFTTTATFTSKSIGTASADRIVVVLAGYNSAGSGPTNMSCNIGGNAATPATQINGTGGGWTLAMFYLAVASGTTANIDLTSDVAGVIQKAYIALGALTGSGLSPSSILTPTDFLPAAQASPYTSGASMTVAAGGVGIAGYLSITNDYSAGGLAGWSNMTLDRHTESPTPGVLHIGLTTSAGSITPSATGLNFDNSGMVGMTFDAGGAPPAGPSSSLGTRIFRRRNQPWTW